MKRARRDPNILVLTRSQILERVLIRMLRRKPRECWVEGATMLLTLLKTTDPVFKAYRGQ